jgi:hypothetical protein
VARQHAAQGVDSDAPLAQGGVEAAPAAAMGRDQAQVDRRGHGVGGQQRVAQVEQRIGAAREAGVEVSAEVAQWGVGGEQLVHAATCATPAGPRATAVAAQAARG